MVVRKKAAKKEVLVIDAPQFKIGTFPLKGTSVYVPNRIPPSISKELADAIREGTASRKRGSKRELEKEAAEQTFQAKAGWYGIPAPAFRIAMIDACRLVGMKMTDAKLSFFIAADGYDKTNGMPLVRLHGPRPQYFELFGKNAKGQILLTVGSRFEGWSCKLRVRWDARQFSQKDIANLLMHAGMSCGVGRGRPFSKMSSGIGWGTFEFA